MISEQLYVWYHTHFIQDILGTIYNITFTLWVQTIVVTTLHPLHLWHHPHYIRHHTHDSTKVISAISPYISNTTSTLCHQTQCIKFITPTLCMTLHTICMTSHEHFMTSHPYRYDSNSSIFMISYPIYMISPILFNENKMTIPVISPTVFDITAIASVWSHPLYQCLHNSYGSLHTWHMYDIIHTLHHIKFRHSDINRQYLGHHKHCIHDIRYPIYDITSMVYDISSHIPVTSQPLYQ